MAIDPNSPLGVNFPHSPIDDEGWENFPSELTRLAIGRTSELVKRSNCQKLQYKNLNNFSVWGTGLFWRLFVIKLKAKTILN
jgi:hypothetical protein